jgi:hypothetical protein
MSEKDLTIQLGQIALEKLGKLLDSLESAKRWGTLDIFSKDLLPTLVKRSKIKKSEIIARDAQIAVENFKNAIVDNNAMTFKVEEISHKTKLIDYFLGSIGNIFVQGKIKSNIDETRKLYNTIHECIEEIKSKNE